jgi:hypothetical protein
MIFRTASRLILLLLLAWGGSGAAALLIGKQQPGAEDVLAHYGFAACELPCWAGITPGVTTSGFIIPLIEKNVPAYEHARFPEWGIVAFQLENDMGGNVRFYEAVNQIYLINIEIPLTYLFEHLTLPDCVSADESAMLMMWMRGENVIISTFLGSPSRILSGGDASSTGLMIFEAGADFCQTYPDWRGFAPVWFYRQQTEKR